jgi:hypothetical protein
MRKLRQQGDVAPHGRGQSDYHGPGHADGGMLPPITLTLSRSQAGLLLGAIRCTREHVGKSPAPTETRQRHKDELAQVERTLRTLWAEVLNVGKE